MNLKKAIYLTGALFFLSQDVYSLRIIEANSNQNKIEEFSPKINDIYLENQINFQEQHIKKKIKESKMNKLEINLDYLKIRFEPYFPRQKR